MLVGSIGVSEHIHSALKKTGTLNYNGHEFENEIDQLAHDILGVIFCMTDDYDVSNEIARRHLGKINSGEGRLLDPPGYLATQIDGVIYPTVQMEGGAYNVSVDAKIFESRSKLIDVREYTIQSLLNDGFKAPITHTSEQFSGDSIIWRMGKRQYVLNENNAEATMICREGCNRFGWYLMSDKRQPVHWQGTYSDGREVGLEIKP